MRSAIQRRGELSFMMVETGARVPLLLPLLLLAGSGELAVTVVAGKVPPPLPRRSAPQTRELKAYPGSTPDIDGVLKPGEWSDAFSFSTSQPAMGSSDVGPNLWTAYFQNVTDAADSSLEGWVKRSDRALFFGFNVTDNFLYAVDAPRWCPPANPGCTPLNQTVT